MKIGRRDSALAVFTLMCGFLVYFGFNTPITFDEAFNWNFYRFFPPLEIVNDYSVSWNNQVPFTLLQRIILPEFISFSPWSIRFFSTFIGISLIGIVMYQSLKQRQRIFLPVLLILGSPMILSYLVIARSYSMTALLTIATFLLTSNVSRVKRNETATALLGVIPLAIAIWALPTIVFMVPLFLIFQTFRHGLGRALKQASFLILLVFMSFAANFTEMLRLSRDNPWSGSPSWFDYLNAFSFQWILTVTALVALIVPFLASVHAVVHNLSTIRSYFIRMSDQDYLAVSAIITGLSYFMLTYVAYLLGIGWPFARNATAPIWLIILGVSLLPKLASWQVRVVYPLLVIIACLAVFSLQSELSNGDYRRINPVFAESVPVGIRDLEGTGVTHIVCSSYDAPVCILSIGLLQKHAISMQLGDGLVANLNCVVGTSKPPPQWQVRLYRGQELWGQLCH